MRQQTSCPVAVDAFGAQITARDAQIAARKLPQRPSIDADHFHLCRFYSAALGSASAV